MKKQFVKQICYFNIINLFKEEYLNIIMCKPFSFITISVETTELERIQIFAAESVTIMHYFPQMFNSINRSLMFVLKINVYHVNVMSLV